MSTSCLGLTTGTSDRVLLLSGSLHAVLTAIFLILEKISRDVKATKPEDAVRRTVAASIPWLVRSMGPYVPFAITNKTTGV